MNKKTSSLPKHIEQCDLTTQAFIRELYSTMTNYCEQQTKPAITHVELRLPAHIDPELLKTKKVDFDNAIYDLIGSVNERLPELGVSTVKTRDNKERSIIGYVWLRVQLSKHNIVYHLYLMTNRDIHFYTGNGETSNSAICNNLSRYWCDALQLDPHDFSWLINQKSLLTKNYGKGNWPTDLMCRIEYHLNIVKRAAYLDPTPWEDGVVMFGSSPSLQISPWE